MPSLGNRRRENILASLTMCVVADSGAFRQLLANLYARGAALQCSFGQESLDLFIPTYAGSVADNATFDPAALSAVVCQVKYRTVGDKRAGDALRPIGIPRDLDQPLPYLALLLELGSTATYQETTLKYNRQHQHLLAMASFDS
jgi:hypothetical protein